MDLISGQNKVRRNLVRELLQEVVDPDPYRNEALATSKPMP
jgi:hypothetical protein